MDGGDTKACPKCAEQIKADAVRCRFCGHEEPKPGGGASGALQKGCGCLGVGVVALMLFGALYPEPKCGEVGYYPKLSTMCRGAQGTADGDRYCSAAELKDMQCASATYARDGERRREEVRRALTDRTY